MTALVVLQEIIGSKLVVTAKGISIWRLMRRTEIPWDSTKAFEIGDASAFSFLSALVVVMGSKKFSIPGTIGFGKRINAIMNDLNNARQRYLVTHEK